MGLGVMLDILLVDHDQAGEVLAPVADDDRVVDEDADRHCQPTKSHDIQPEIQRIHHQEANGQ